MIGPVIQRDQQRFMWLHPHRPRQLLNLSIQILALMFPRLAVVFHLPEQWTSLT
jgi:hypothetical protein